MVTAPPKSSHPAILVFCFVALAVVPFSQLERLKQTNPTLATKINDQLARAAVSKLLENDGRSKTLRPREFGPSITLGHLQLVAPENSGTS